VEPIIDDFYIGDWAFSIHYDEAFHPL